MSNERQLNTERYKEDNTHRWKIWLGNRGEFGEQKTNEGITKIKDDLLPAFFKRTQGALVVRTDEIKASKANLVDITISLINSSFKGLLSMSSRGNDDYDFSLVYDFSQGIEHVMNGMQYARAKTSGVLEEHTRDKREQFFEIMNPDAIAQVMIIAAMAKSSYGEGYAELLEADGTGFSLIDRVVEDLDRRENAPSVKAWMVDGAKGAASVYKKIYQQIVDLRKPK